MNRRIFLKAAGITLLLSSPVLALKQENQWINVDTQKPPMNEEIVILKYTKDIDPKSPRNVASLFVGKIVERHASSAVFILPKASYTVVMNKDIDKEDYYRIEKNVNYDKEIEKFFVENYAKGVCKQNDYYWWYKYHNINNVERKDSEKIRIGFHMMNSKNMRTYWTPINKMPKQLP